MALTIPILLSQVSFDSANPQTFLFNVIGGSQVVGNTLKIINNTTGLVSYEQSQTTFKFEHILPANTLTNGITYTAQIKTIDAQGGTSSWSNTIIFTCYTTPILEFTNMPVTNIIPNSNYTFNATYNQVENELLNSYEFILYDSANNEISFSGIQYVGSTTPPPTNMSYNFSGFENNTVYKIELQGITTGGTFISTGLIQFTASYEQPVAFGIVQVENNCDGGYVNIISNMLSITSESNPSPPIYIENKEVSVAEQGQYVAWTDGFQIPEDFTMRIWGRAFAINDTFCIANNTNNVLVEIRLNYLPNTVTQKVYVQGVFYNGSLTPTTVNSNEIVAPIARDQLFVWVRVVNGVPTIQIEVTYVSPDRTYTWYDVDNRLYTFQDVDNLAITWADANQGGW